MIIIILFKILIILNKTKIYRKDNKFKVKIKNFLLFYLNKFFNF
jgi:hypothetical protein